MTEEELDRVREWDAAVRSANPDSLWLAEIHRADLLAHIDHLQGELERLREALGYIRDNDLSYLLGPTPKPKGYPGHFSEVARAALQEKQS